MININMRCIEISKVRQKTMILIGLTLTWDVLKYDSRGFFKESRMWLTLTWDVLKSPIGYEVNSAGVRLTLTWDVLKYSQELPIRQQSRININMRCIEMIKGTLGVNAVLD